jgi:CelD/BcsL family acetyltransferase involved in cellulose biosynthesis
MRSADPGATAGAHATCDSAVTVERYSRLDALPPEIASLFADAPDFFSTRPWWDAVLAHAIPAGATPCLVLVRSGAASGLFPMLSDPEIGGFRALTTPYSCRYTPLIAAEPADRTKLLAAFAGACRQHPTTRFDTLSANVASDLAAAGRRAGLAIARFAHFGDWHEDVDGLDWASYLARRPGALRETVRRRARRAERLTDSSFRVFRDLSELPTAIAAFEAVYARSWKDAEPFPSFNEAQIRAAADLGIMRLGVWWIGGTPAAAQFWIVEHGRATVLKLAHDEAFRAHSPGTLLTAWMVRDMIEREGARVLDFGRGDDPYKSQWVANRTQFGGVLWINPLRPRGFAALARHAAGRLRARLRGASSAWHGPPPSNRSETDARSA